MKAYRNLSKFEPDKPFEAWLYRIASNQCIDYLRKRKLSRFLPFLYQKDQDNRHVDQVIEHKYYNPSVLRALARLTAEERSLLILRCVEDKSYHEISLILQQSTTYLRKNFSEPQPSSANIMPWPREETNEHGQRPGPETTLSEG